MSIPGFTAEATIENVSYAYSKGEDKNFDSPIKIEPAMPRRQGELCSFRVTNYDDCEVGGGAVSPRYKRCRRQVTSCEYADGEWSRWERRGEWIFPLPNP